MRSHVPVLATLALLACGPFITLPGGELSGAVQPTPTDWAFAESVDTVQLETRPDDPYSVNVWGVGLGEHFFVASGDGEGRWARHIEADPRVRLRIGDDVFELRAERSEDSAEREAFLAALEEKYAWQPDPEEKSRAVLYRLSPR